MARSRWRRRWRCRLGAGVESLDARALAARLGEVERAIRKLEAVAASIIATADRRRGVPRGRSRVGALVGEGVDPGR